MTLPAASCARCAPHVAEQLCDVCGDLLCPRCVVPVPMPIEHGGRMLDLCPDCHRHHAIGHAVLRAKEPQSGGALTLLLAVSCLGMLPFALISLAAAQIVFGLVALGSSLAIAWSTSLLKKVADGSKEDAAGAMAWAAASLATLATALASAELWVMYLRGP